MPRRPSWSWPCVRARAALPARGAGDDRDALIVYSGPPGAAGRPAARALRARERRRRCEVRYGDCAELAATLAEEGDGTPGRPRASSQDAGALGAVERAGLLAPLPAACLDRVDERYRSPGGRWVGVTGRARVVAYSTERVRAGRAARLDLRLHRPEWRGRIGFPPPNASFQAFVSAMRLVGRRRPHQRLAGGHQAQRADPPGEQHPDRGGHRLGRDRRRLRQPLLPRRARRPSGRTSRSPTTSCAPRDPGSLVNVSGVGIVEGSRAGRRCAAASPTSCSPSPAQARLPRAALRVPADRRAAARRTACAPLGGPRRARTIALGALGGKLESTLRLLAEVGFTT